MKGQLSIVAMLSLAAATLNAQEPTPAVVRRSAPPPRPAAASSAPAAVAPQPRPQTSFAPVAAGPHGLGLGSGVYRPLPSYTGRFQPTGRVPAYRNWNRPTNTVATGVTPRVGSIPQQNAAATTTNGGTRSWNPGSRTWNRPGTANTNVGPGNANATSANNWRTRNANGYANWQDARSHYDHHRHDRDWWRRHHDRIIFVNNGYYFWDSGWWYPAWGYDAAYDYYAYDGPIYGYDGLPPDQVIARVQTALQQQGYYLGMIDGELGPMTQQALAAWQRDHGLAITTAIDYPTLASLGLS